MMAYDSRSTPERRALSAETLDHLRLAVLRLWAEPHDADAPLAAALDALVAEARTRTLGAEEVLVAVKDLLQALPELGSPERRMEAVRFREQLVTRCIKAYYAGSGGDASGGDASGGDASGGNASGGNASSGDAR